MTTIARIGAAAALFFAVAVPLPGRSLATAQESFAQGEPSAAEKVGKDLTALRIAASAPRIDGVLDDEVWNLAQVLDDLVQTEPENMADPTERTTVQVAYDERYIYVAVHAMMQDPSLIAAGLGRRDNFPTSDRIAIGFDPRHDHLTGYLFQVNPSGVKGDLTYFDDTSTSSDYDGVWDVATGRSSEGWIAEFRIPFSQMRFAAAPGRGTWGFGVRRDISRRGEYALWIGSPRGTRGLVSRWGHLHFDEGVSSPQRLEVSPFFLGRSEHLPGRDAVASVDGGIDLRYGLGSAATLSMTLNPDFGQVEQDPAVLNLSVFETQFRERRPFFLEDSRTFVLPYGQFPLFYSPRIGRRPGRIPLQSTDRLVSQPDRTTILGAVKLTGKSGPWTYGGLTALTDQEFALVDASVTEASGSKRVDRLERLIEPRTAYSVLRLQCDILSSSSNVGAIATAVVREGHPDAFTGGVDGNFRWDRNRYALNNHYVVTHAPFGQELRSGFGGASNFSFLTRNFNVNGHFDYFSR